MKQAGMLVLVVALCMAGAGPALAGPVRATGDPVTREKALAKILEAAFPDPSAARPTTGRELFLAALGSKAFEHAEVGCFDLYAYRKDGLAGQKARKAVDDAAEGLKPVAKLVAQRFPVQEGVQGVIAGHRFPLVFVSSDPDKNETAFDEVLALLDECEDLGYSGWKPFYEVFSPACRNKSEGVTWEVRVFNLSHPDLKQQGREFANHALGYLTLTHLIGRLFAKGPVGPVPPWLKQGLVDELDIEAYGNAWVATDASSNFSWRSQSAGWSRQGWEGFLPQGAAPPPPVTGAPPDLPTTYSATVSSDTWMDRGGSATRHWSELAGDRKSEVPAAFRLMAGTQTYAPRDRAYARCVLHLLIQLAPPEGPGLLPTLDKEAHEKLKGVSDAEPLTVSFAQVMGGVPAVDEMEKETLEQQLNDLGRADLIDKLKSMNAEPMLAMPDHRSQGEWLYHRYKYSAEDRQFIFATIHEIEALQELREWEVLGAKLDQAADAALKASSSYPKAPKTAEKVAESFRGALKA